MITANSPVQNLYESNGKIFTSGNIVIETDEQITYQAKNEVVLNIGYTVELGAEFEADTNASCE